jgi:hypothetical protein
LDKSCGNPGKPTHIACVVNEPKAKKGGETPKPFWRPVGAVWPHTKGNGFDLVIYDQLAVSGRIVCTAPKDEPKDDKSEAPAQSQ